MRVVIPYKLSGNGEELRYAIRSMYKHFIDITGVLVIGDKPDWYKGDHIDRGDIRGQKELSIMSKVLMCPDGAFLYSNDDFFALKDFQVLTLPDYHDYTCAEMAMKHGKGRYRDMYAACQPQWLNFDVHTPMFMHLESFKERFDLMDEQIPIKTMYAHNSPRAEYYTDSKIRGYHTTKELEYHIWNREFFSTHDSAIDDTMIKFLRNLYPDASPAE